MATKRELIEENDELREVIRRFRDQIQPFLEEEGDDGDDSTASIEKALESA